MAEGLSASEVGKEIGEHAKHSGAHDRRDRLISISEAALLSIVAVLAAWSGYAAAKWSTESRVELATASSVRIEASRADADAFELRNFDSSTFESWFSAYIAGDKTAMRLAERRFRRVQGCLRRLARDETGSSRSAPECPSTGPPPGGVTCWQVSPSRHSRFRRGMANDEVGGLSPVYGLYASSRTAEVQARNGRDGCEEGRRGRAPARERSVRMDIGAGRLGDPSLGGALDHLLARRRPKLPIDVSPMRFHRVR